MSDALRDAAVPLLSNEPSGNNNDVNSGGGGGGEGQGLLGLGQHQQQPMQQQQNDCSESLSEHPTPQKQPHVDVAPVVKENNDDTRIPTAPLFGLHSLVSSGGVNVGVGNIYSPLGTSDGSHDGQSRNSSTSSSSPLFPNRSNATFGAILCIGLAILFTINDLCVQHVYSRSYSTIDNNKLWLVIELVKLVACLVVEFMEYMYVSRRQSATAGSDTAPATVVPPAVPSSPLTPITTVESNQRKACLSSWLFTIWDAGRMSLPPLLTWLQRSWSTQALDELSYSFYLMEEHARLLFVAAIASTSLLPLPHRRCYSRYQWLCLFTIVACTELEVFSDVTSSGFYTNGIPGFVHGTLVLLASRLAGAVALVYTERVVKESPPPLSVQTIMYNGWFSVSAATPPFPNHIQHDDFGDSLRSSGATTVYKNGVSIWRRGAQQACFAAMIWAMSSLVANAKYKAEQESHHTIDDDIIFLAIDTENDEADSSAGSIDRRLVAGLPTGVWMLIVSQVPLYLGTLVVLYYTDSVYKTLAGSLSYVLTDLAVIVWLGTAKLTFLFVVGAAAAIPAMYAFHKSNHVSGSPSGNRGRAAALGTSPAETVAANEDSDDATHAVEMGTLLLSTSTVPPGTDSPDDAPVVGPSDGLTD